MGLRRSTVFSAMALQSSRVILRVGGPGAETLRFDLVRAKAALIAFYRECREPDGPAVR